MFPSAFVWLVAALCASSALTATAAEIAPNRGALQELRIQKANEIQKYMNLAIDPCKDFYEFACGNWSQHQKEQKGQTVTVKRLMEQDVSRQLIELLDKSSNRADETLSASKVKNFYRSCIKASLASSEHQDFVLDILKRYHGMPGVPHTGWQTNYDWIQVIAALHYHFGMDILIGLEIDTNFYTMRGNAIFLGEPRTTLLPPELCSSAATSRYDLDDRVYGDVTQQVAANVKQWFKLGEKEAKRFAEEIVRYEIELCKGMRREQPLSSPQSDAEDEEEDADASQYGGHGGRMPRQRIGRNRQNGNHRYSPYPRKHLKQFTQQFGGIIDFKRFVDRSFNFSIDVEVYMRSNTYFEHLAQTIKHGAKPTLANYIMYRAVSEISPPSDTSYGARTEHCVALVRRHFPKIVGDMYNRRYHRSEVYSELDVLFNEIKRVFDLSLDVEWLPKETQRTAHNRLLEIKMGFPLYHNLDLDDLPLERMNSYWTKLEMAMGYSAKKERDRFFTPDSVYSRRLDSIEAPDVNMHLMPMISVLLVGWGLLQEPLYRHDYPNSLKYSLVGQHIARELLTAFDEQGWRRSPLSPVLWDAYTTESFRNRSECFRAQYSNYLHDQPHVFHNATIMREIIADAGGLNVAFRSYLAWLDGMDLSQRHTLAKETLPDLNYTNTQLFFISFAQMRCTTAFTEDAPPPDFLPMASHTPERYAVNGPLSNNVEFAREFGCTIGSPMNLSDKCMIY